MALRYATPVGYVRTFVEEGEPMRQLLESAEEYTRFPDAVRRLLNAFPVQTAALSPSRRPALIEPLNDREEEILRLLAQKRSRQEIAEALILSINTVKWHINNLYAKLGVDKRGAAVARAVELGIL
ncbi:MAG: hypothetical protein KF893_03725 [Caldilineaceae bacterium]|nr:hypothetical protein [Caldilineaceae bacterium]